MVNQTESYHLLIGQALSQIWGYSEFRPLQMDAIQAIVDKRDSLTVLPTGGGKSLCYQLPAAILPGTAIIISPLIALMEDQVNALRLLGIPAAFLNSSLRVDELRKTKAQMFRNEHKLLYISPERLLLEHFLEELKQIQISFFAIDEAHCISQWGHDFRPEYRQLSKLRETFTDIGIHGFTATAPPKIQEEIQTELRLKDPKLMVGSYHRPNLCYRVLRRNQITKQILAQLKKFSKSDNGIVYCLTRKETERVADVLAREGYKALPYHAGLDAEVRKQNQDLFAQEKVHIIAATVAFGMGIDQSNVRFVIHAGMPRTLSHYQQEAGRAGRDGLPSQCVLIYGANDIQFWKRIIEEEPSLREIRLAQLQEMIRYASEIKCRHKMLIEHFGQDFEPPNCGNCDICLGEIESIQKARTFGKMILSAVLKLRQGFGGAYVAQILTKSQDKKILRNRHNHLSVYGLLSDYNQHQVQDWVSQLESQGFLQRARGEYPTLSVTSQGYWLLRPEKYGKTEADVPIVLVETHRKETKRGVDAASARANIPADYDRILFEKLRNERALIAARIKKPAYIVFSDRSLIDMAHRKPVDESEFLHVFGVGEHKLQRFGLPMIRIIREHLQKNAPDV